MSWISVPKQGFVIGKFLQGFVQGFVRGSVDEACTIFSDAEISRFQDSGALLQNCEPWENHLKEEAYVEINKALKKNNYINARKAISMHVTETADPSCLIIALKMVMLDVCTKCATILKESLPKKIIVPKS